jgi:hypothetical protein
LLAGDFYWSRHLPLVALSSLVVILTVRHSSF